MVADFMLILNICLYLRPNWSLSMMVTLSDNSGTAKYLKIIPLVTAVTAILLIMVWLRAFYGSMQACQEGETYLKAGQHMKAITFFDRSIHWYTPFNPYVEKSAETLWEMSQDAEAKGDIRLALIAARTIRRGFIAARSFYTPGKDWIKKCDLKIYELLKIEQERKDDLAVDDIMDTSVLENPQVKGPDVMWSIILLVGLLGWIGTAIAFIISGFRDSHKTSPVSLSNLKWILLCALFFAIWVIGMTMA